jgi:hypothetical protein
VKLGRHARALEVEYCRLVDAFQNLEARLWARLHSFAMSSEAGAVHAAKRNDGMVKIEATPHLRECAKVLVPGSGLCTCGSQPRTEKPN